MGADLERCNEAPLQLRRDMVFQTRYYRTNTLLTKPALLRFLAIYVHVMPSTILRIRLQIHMSFRLGLVAQRIGPTSPTICLSGIEPSVMFGSEVDSLLQRNTSSYNAKMTSETNSLDYRSSVDIPTVLPQHKLTIH